MPQNPIIRADGSGDYTSPIAFEAAEQNSDYGAVTNGRLDGFFDLGASQLDVNGAWPNGFRLECFDSADAFDGTERKLCGITSSSPSITLRNRGHNIELSGVEVYNTGTGIAYSNTVIGGNLDHQGCLFRTESNTAHRANTTLGAGTFGCVTASLTGNPNLGGVYNQCSMFTTLNSAVGSSATTTIDNTVIVNSGTGACYRGTVTQNNNASTDATADTLTNIVIADNFVSATPVASGDYRIKSGSPLDINSIGPFVQASAGETIAADPGTYALIGDTVELSAQRTTQADAGSYALAGADVDLLAQRSLTADAGSYVLTGADVTFPSGETLTAEPGSYTITGSDVALTAQRITQADAGSYALTGSDVGLLAQRSLTADAGSYALTGADVNLFANRVIVAEKGEYTLTGSAVQLIYSGDTTQVVTKITATFKAVDITPSYAQAWSVNFKDQ